MHVLLTSQRPPQGGTQLCVAVPHPMQQSQMRAALSPQAQLPHVYQQLWELELPQLHVEPGQSS